jgi:hypothetical protein
MGELDIVLEKLLINKLNKEEKEAFDSLKISFYPISDKEAYKLLKSAKTLGKVMK